MAELAHRVEFYSLQRKIHIHGVTKYHPKYDNFLCRIFLELEKAKINEKESELRIKKIQDWATDLVKMTGESPRKISQIVGSIR